MEFTYPGVYVEEFASGAHTIEGVPTSTAAFVGATKSGPVAAPELVHSFKDFEARYGGLSEPHPLTYAVQQFFFNGGREALIARVEPAGASLTDADFCAPALEAQKRGLWLLEYAERFNILSIPPLTRTSDIGAATWSAASTYASKRGAILIVDPPAAWTDASAAVAGVGNLIIRSKDAALYFPRLQFADPLRGNQVVSFAPCGAVAGIYARTDETRGVWKAPAGEEAVVHGAAGLSVSLSEAQIGTLNPSGINVLRSRPGAGAVVWGARTLASEASEPEAKYVPVRRLATYIEQSITAGLQWAIFEPNGEALWAQIRSSVGAFLDGLFRQGGLQGTRPEEAYFVRCGADTTTQADLDTGICNVVVGFAPLRPAEFVIIGLKELAHTAEAYCMVARRFGIRMGRYALSVMADGQTLAAVGSVRGLTQLTEIITHREGGDAGAAHLLPGRTTYEPVTLTRAVGQDGAFAAWAKAAREAGTAGAKSARRDVRIEIYDARHKRTIAGT
jgi:uncharacterized protein